MTSKTRSIFFAAFFIIALLSAMFSFASHPLFNSPAPPFKVASGDKEVLTLADIKDKVVVLFYEAKSAIEQNRKLKDSLNVFYAAQPEQIKKEIIRIGVIDCQGVIFTGAWEKALRDNSLKEGITLYGDWDGKMSTDYQAERGESNLIIIDKKGLIKYYSSGAIEDKNISAIEGLLKQLVREN
jgi:predicted transcriptional regulator